MKRLTLQRETLLNLNPDHMSDINGGSTPLCVAGAIVVLGVTGFGIGYITSHLARTCGTCQCPTRQGCQVDVTEGVM